MFDVDSPVNSIPFSKNKLSCGRRPATVYWFPTPAAVIPDPPTRSLV